MNLTSANLVQVVLVGVAATATMDLWLLLLRAFGVPTLNFALIGRWVGHWRNGVFAHAAIAEAQPIAGERALGWTTHYVTGVIFAALTVMLAGADWLREPSLLPAIGTGVLSVAAPWLVMQPAMGAGIASSRTPSPRANRVRSLANHTVFGIGLYIAAALATRVLP